MAAEQLTPTVVVGAGPAGFSAAMTLARSGVPVVVIERSDSLGGDEGLDGVVVGAGAAYSGCRGAGSSEGTHPRER